MDHEDWVAYTYPKSLGKHDLPKLGVPRLCERLRASMDLNGEVYLDNVDVNGVITTADGPSVQVLACLLNSRALDFFFRRVSVPFRGAYLSANKQFIAPLPVRVPEGALAGQIEATARELYESASGTGQERAAFLTWLEGAIGARVRGLQGQTRLRSYETLTLDELLGVLRRNQARLGVAADTRSFRETLEAEFRPSVERIVDHRNAVDEKARFADELVYELYELTADQRAVIDAEYGA